MTCGAVLLLCSALAPAQSGPTWTQVFPASNPFARSNFSMAYDSAHGEIVFFGGVDYTLTKSGSISTLARTFLGDTWVWNGSNFVHQTPPSSPSARYGAAMAYDSLRGQVLLFGGYDINGNHLNDTWTWDGVNWTQQSPQSSPPGRLSAGMAYFQASQQIVLFGGAGANGYLADTWIWDGKNWQQVTPPATPPAREDAGMVYDASEGVIVLFGGTNTKTAFSDTWVWDGANWSQLSPAANPPPRSSFGMTYVAAHSQVILFGGFAANTDILDDTWTFNGINWTQLAPQNSPPPLTGFGMAYDTAQDQTLVFGGSGTPTDLSGDSLNATYTLTPGGAPEPVINAVVTASDFGAFTTVAPGAWIEIYGANFAPTAASWSGADFSGNNAPTSLDGIQVSIGKQVARQNAFVEYVSPGQVNVQLPSGFATGTQGIELTSGNLTPGSLTSDPFFVDAQNTSAGLLAPPSFNIGGNQYVVAILPDGSYALPAGAISGVASRPAKPGETVVLYGVNFGAVTPTLDAGMIETQTNQLASPFQVSFGTTPAQLAYDGLAPNYVGLYQFNIVVPSVPAADLVPFSFTLNNVPSAQTLSIAVGQ